MQLNFIVSLINHLSISLPLLVQIRLKALMYLTSKTLSYFWSLPVLIEASLYWCAQLIIDIREVGLEIADYFEANGGVGCFDYLKHSAFESHYIFFR